MSDDQDWLESYKQRLHNQLSEGQAFLAEHDLGYLRTTTEAIAHAFDQSGLAPKERELIVLAVLGAQGSWDAVRMHIRRALMNAIPPREILGAFKIAAVSAGLPVAVGGAEALKQELEQLNKPFE